MPARLQRPPYYLHDVPRMPCVVIAYAATTPTKRATVAALVGEAPMPGVSPADAFCGHADVRC